MNDIFPIIVTGTAQGVPLFVIASGLTLIYGVMHELNFALTNCFVWGHTGMAKDPNSTELEEVDVEVILTRGPGWGSQFFFFFGTPTC